MPSGTTAATSAWSWPRGDSGELVLGARPPTRGGRYRSPAGHLCPSLELTVAQCQKWPDDRLCRSVKRRVFEQHLAPADELQDEAVPNVGPLPERRVARFGHGRELAIGDPR